MIRKSFNFLSILFVYQAGCNNESDKKWKTLINQLERIVFVILENNYLSLHL